MVLGFRNPNGFRLNEEMLKDVCLFLGSPFGQLAVQRVAMLRKGDLDFNQRSVSLERLKFMSKDLIKKWETVSFGKRGEISAFFFR